MWGANEPPAKSARHLDAQEKAAAAALRSADGAKRSGLTSFPGFIELCHPSERDRPPWGDPWVQEIKADGYRRRCMCATARLIVYSRRGHDWTETFASIARIAESLPVQHVVLDGEAVVQDTRGIADYHALRRELARKRVSSAEAPGLPLGAP